MLLLDTCAALWMALEPQELASAAKRRIDRAMSKRELYVSPISAWEIGMLVSRNRLELVQPLEIIIAQLFDVSRISIASLSQAICWRSSFLPGNLHRDPADRLLIATARELNLTLVTRDELIFEYAKQGHVGVLPC